MDYYGELYYCNCYCSCDLAAIATEIEFSESDAATSMLPCVLRSLLEHPVEQVRRSVEWTVTVGHGLREAVDAVTDSMWTRYCEERDEVRAEIAADAADGWKIINVVMTVVTCRHEGRLDVEEVLVDINQKGIYMDPFKDPVYFTPSPSSSELDCESDSDVVIQN